MPSPWVDNTHLAAQQSPMEGLRFFTTSQDLLPASEALTALAEGQAQCAVTGTALEHLLQHHDLLLLESVMQTVVVFSRMQPHQKGQVMDLMGMHGIHQLLNGRPRYIPVGTLTLTSPSPAAHPALISNTHIPNKP